MAHSGADESVSWKGMFQGWMHCSAGVYIFFLTQKYFISYKSSTTLYPPPCPLPGGRSIFWKIPLPLPSGEGDISQCHLGGKDMKRRREKGESVEEKGERKETTES
jgi:hypothetical protein